MYQLNDDRSDRVHHPRASSGGSGATARGRSRPEAAGGGRQSAPRSSASPPWAVSAIRGRGPRAADDIRPCRIPVGPADHRRNGGEKHQSDLHRPVGRAPAGRTRARSGGRRPDAPARLGRGGRRQDAPDPRDRPAGWRSRVPRPPRCLRRDRRRRSAVRADRRRAAEGIGPDDGDLARVPRPARPDRAHDPRPVPRRHRPGAAGRRPIRRPRRPTDDVPVNSVSTQSDLFDALLRILQDLSAAGPVLLVVEDLHWADPATRLALTYLVPSLATDRVDRLPDLADRRARPAASAPAVARRARPDRRGSSGSICSGSGATTPPG